MVSITELVEQADTVVSVCPPDQAVAVATSIARIGFDGVYVDANAIAPQQMVPIEELFAGRADVVDGGIIGPPAWRAGTTRMYLSGTRAADVARRWNGAALDVRVVGSSVGAASALKMAFASWSKGTTALLLAANAVAAAYDVDAELGEEWAISQPDAPRRSQQLAGIASKAWRFEGEMREISATFAAVGVPGGFHDAAAEVYHRLAGFKDAEPPTLDELVAAVLAER